MDIFSNLLPLILIIGLFYLFMILPQQKMAKQRQAMLDGLKEGDKIETVSRVFAKIVKVEKDRLTIDISANNKKNEIVIHIEGVARVLPDNIEISDTKADDSDKADNNDKADEAYSKWSKNK
jgi:preprotein translocase subunit YajC